MRIAALIALLATAGCSPTFAPPVRSGGYGAPGRMMGQTWEVGGSATHHGTGGPYAGLVVAPGLAVEVGGELSLVDDEARWALGVAGLRYTFHQLRNEDRSGAAFDLELGGGLGVGGTIEGDPGGWSRRLAGGGYFGFGVAYHADEWFAAFTRARVQLTEAARAPMTFWWQFLIGPEVTVGPVSFYIAGGYAGFRNELDAPSGALLDGGISLHY